MTETLQQILIRHEGLKLKLYKCPAGKWTIGVGHNIEDNGITKAEAMHILNNDIHRCEREARTVFVWFDELNKVRQDVIINMLFNMGFPTFLGFKRMISALVVGNYELASHEMLDSAWARQVGDRAIELARIMDTGSNETPA